MTTRNASSANKSLKTPSLADQTSEKTKRASEEFRDYFCVLNEFGFSLEMKILILYYDVICKVNLSFFIFKTRNMNPSVLRDYVCFEIKKLSSYVRQCRG